MTNTIVETTIRPEEESFYRTKKGEVPFWDHPFLKGSKKLPQKYYPYTTLEGVLNLQKRRKFDDKDFMLLKVLGDSICSNEDQLRRYMSTKMSRSEVSKRLEKFREVGLVDRWKLRIRGEEEGYKPPAPFTLGIAGYKLLKHFYGDMYFVDPNRWDKLGIGGIKRHVAMNELRCKLTEIRAISNWKWNAVIANNRTIKFPMGAAELRSPQGNLNLLIDRAQMSQDFIGYFRERLNVWKTVYEKRGSFPIDGLSDNKCVVVIYTSTLSVATEIHKQLMLDTFGFPIWVCVEEDMLEDDLSTAFYIPNKDDLSRVRFDFLDGGGSFHR